jgi:hypothetical protein
VSKLVPTEFYCVFILFEEPSTLSTLFCAHTHTQTFPRFASCSALCTDKQKSINSFNISFCEFVLQTSMGEQNQGLKRVLAQDIAAADLLPLEAHSDQLTSSAVGVAVIEGAAPPKRGRPGSCDQQLQAPRSTVLLNNSLGTVALGDNRSTSGAISNSITVQLLGALDTAATRRILEAADGAAARAEASAAAAGMSELGAKKYSTQAKGSAKKASSKAKKADSSANDAGTSALVANTASMMAGVAAEIQTQSNCLLTAALMDQEARQSAAATATAAAALNAAGAAGAAGAAEPLQAEAHN